MQLQRARRSRAAHAPSGPATWMKSFSLFCLRSFKFFAVCGSITCQELPSCVQRCLLRGRAAVAHLAHVIRQLIHQRSQAAAFQHEAARHATPGAARRRCRIRLLRVTLATPRASH